MKYSLSKFYTKQTAIFGILVFGFSFIVLRSSAQSLPNTEIFLVPIVQSDSGISLGGGRMVTQVKRYDDQPSFSYDSRYMYYASEGDDYKMDIRTVYIPQYQDVEFIGTGSVSEWYPQQKPDMSGIGLVQDAVLLNTRQVWFYGTDATSKSLTPTITNVLSFSWLSDTTLALTVPTKTGNALCRFNLKTNKHDTLVHNVGNSFVKVPSEDAVYYTQTDQGLERLYRRYLNTGNVDTLLYLPGGAVDFAVAVDGSLWCANKGLVYRWPRAGAKWEVMTDFGSGALGNAFRVAVSRDLKWLAVVSQLKP